MGLNIGRMIRGAFSGMFNKLLGPLKQIWGKIQDVFKKLQNIGLAIAAFFEFIGYSFEWFFAKFIPWIFVPWPTTMFKPKRKDMVAQAGAIPWMLRYIVIFIYNIILFPKCFIWYLLSTIGWLIYTPFRFIFWLIDYMTGMKLTKMDHDIWDFLNGIDYYVHGPRNNYFIHQFSRLKNPDVDPIMGKVEYQKFKYTTKSGKDVEIDVISSDLSSLEEDKDSLNLGFHIIHYPNSIMNTCYTSTPYRLASLPKYDKSKYNKMKNFKI